MDVKQILAELDKRQLRNPCDAEEKVIRAILEDNEFDQLLLVFADGTFLYLATEVDGDSVDFRWRQLLRPHDPFLCAFDADELAAAGLLNEADANVVRNGRDQLGKADRRRQYERLKAEFEAGGMA